MYAHKLFAFSLRCLVGCLAVICSCQLVAQSSLRGWARVSYDTESRNGTFLQVAAGRDESLVLRSDGMCFGQGEGSLGGCAVPLPPFGLHYTDIGTSGQVAVGLLSDGTLATWGSYNFQTFPLPSLPAGLRYLDVAAAGENWLAVRSDGAVVAWGLNFSGECNVPSFGGVRAVKVEAGGAHVVALLANGSIMAWGDNQYGQLQVPQLASGLTFVDIAARGAQTLALVSDGSVLGWGDNRFGQLQVPPLPSGLRYVSIGCGTQHSLLVRSDGALLAFGYNGGWVGNYYLGGQCNVPVLPPGVSFVQAVGGGYHSIALLSNGKVLTWGSSSFTQGYLPELAVSERWLGVKTAGFFSLGLVSDGRIEAWGDNRYGQCDVPALPAGRRYVKVAAASLHALALRDDGLLVGWGLDIQGELAIPPLPPGVAYTDVATGDQHTVALRSDGTAVQFTLQYQTGGIPNPPSGMRYVSVDVEGRKTLLLRSDGTILKFGGMLNYPTPPALPAGVAYSQIAACADDARDALLRTDGQVVIWGHTYPIGASGWIPVPPLPPGVVYVEVRGGLGVMVARRSDGEVVVFGYITGPSTVVPGLLPGTSYVGIDAAYYMMSARVGPTSTYTSFATGCAGSQQPARLVPQDTPHIDKTHEVIVFDLPNDAAFMLFGWSRTAPQSLAQYGMPGCSAHVSPDGVYFLAGQNGIAKYRLPIPNAPGLVGLHFFNQAVVPDFLAGNPLGAVMSEAAEGVVGHW